MFLPELGLTYGNATLLVWRGQRVLVDVDGAAEEGSPFIPARGKRRITFTPSPSGFRSITHTIGLEQIWPQVSMAASLGHSHVPAHELIPTGQVDVPPGSQGKHEEFLHRILPLPFR